MVLFQHDNAWPPTSGRTTEAIGRLDFTALRHPPYSPNLAPSDFYLLPKLKEHLCGEQFSSESNVKDIVNIWSSQLDAQFQRDSIIKLLDPWQKMCGP